MAAFDFPASPTDGQTYTPAGSSVTYTYSNASKVWKAVTPTPASLTAGRVLLGDGTSTPATDAELTYDATKNNLTVGGTVVMGSQFSFRNKIINGDMRINQRGVTIAAAAVGAYGPDRWKKTAGGMTQIVESGNFKPNTVYTISGTGVTTAQITSPATGHWTIPDVPIAATNIQLEEGTVATPFEHRPIGLELQLCYRYYEQSNTLQYLFHSTNNFSASHGNVVYKATKRIIPTCTWAVDPANTGTLFSPTIGLNGFACAVGGTNGGLDAYLTKWTADAEL